MTQDMAWAIGLVLIAAILLGLEFTLPTGGLLGIGSLLALAAALFLAFSDSVWSGIGLSAAVLLLFPLVIAGVVRVWPYTPIGRRILNLPVDGDQGLAQVDERFLRLQQLVGQVGVAKTDLLPGGLVEIDGQRWDAIALGTVVDRDHFVEVVSVEAGKIRVRETQRRPGATASTLAVDEKPLDLGETSLDELDLEDLGDPLA